MFQCESYSEKIDIWGVGLIAFIIAFKNNWNKIYNKNEAAIRLFGYFSKFSRIIKEFTDERLRSKNFGF